MPSNPVDRAATLAGAIIVLFNSAVAMLSGLGYVHWDTTQQALVNGFVIALVNVGAIVGPMFWARKQVTPLESPKDEDGTPLRRLDGSVTTAQGRAARKRVGLR